MKKGSEEENNILAELGKKAIPIIVVLSMNLLVKPSFNIAIFQNWENVLLTIFSESYGLLVCGFVSIFFRFKSNIISVTISALFVIIINSIVKFDLRTEFAEDNKVFLILYTVGIVFGLVPIFFLRNIRRWKEQDDEAFWRKRIYNIVVWVICISSVLWIVADIILLTRYINRYGWISYG